MTDEELWDEDEDEHETTFIDLEDREDEELFEEFGEDGQYSDE